MDPIKSPVFLKTVGFLVRTQYWPRQKLSEWQLKRLRYLVRYVQKNIPFYAKFMRKHGLSWDDFKSVHDIRRFPFITKRLIQDNYDEFLPINIDKRKLIHKTTGGSTGTPLTVYGDADFYAKYKANTEYYMRVFGLDIFHYRSIRLYGDKIEERLLKQGIYWRKSGARKLVMSCYHITGDTAVTYIDKINEFQPLYIHTKPSSILPLANYILKQGLMLKSRIRYIFCDGEYITDGQRRQIETALGARLINIYGHTEGCTVAHPCQFSDSLHFMPQVGIVELLNEKDVEVKEEGRKGELVVTGFNNLIFPLIRYRTQDIGVLGNQKCACARNYKILRSIEGRVQDYVVDRDGNLVPLAPAIFNYNDMDWKGVREFKVVQEKEGELIFKIWPEEDASYKLERIRSVFTKKIEQIFGFTFKVGIEFVRELHKTEIGKYRYLEQRLNLNNYKKVMFS